MSAPTRYDIKVDGDDSCMQATPHGDYVNYDSYLELEERIADLEKQIQRAKEALE